MAKKGKQRIGECAYCGGLLTISREHVIPKSLFPSPAPSNVITVPCCSPCNNQKSGDDNYFRDFIVSDMYASLNPSARAIFRGSLTRSIMRRSSEFARVVASSGKLEPFFSPDGAYAGNIVSIPLDEERVQRIFASIVRGLYYYAFEKRIPDNYIFEARRWKSEDFIEILNFASASKIRGKHIVGNIFGSMHFLFQEDPFSSLWVLWFYEGIFFTATSVNPMLIMEQNSE